MRPCPRSKVKELQQEKADLMSQLDSKKAERDEVLAEKIAVAERVNALSDADADSMGVSKPMAAEILAEQQGGM